MVNDFDGPAKAALHGLAERSVFYCGNREFRVSVDDDDIVSVQPAVIGNVAYLDDYRVFDQVNAADEPVTPELVASVLCRIYSECERSGSWTIE